MQHVTAITRRRLQGQYISIRLRWVQIIAEGCWNSLL